MSLLDLFTEEEILEMEDACFSEPKSDSVAGVIEGLEILSKYYEKGMEQTYFFGAEHDIVYFYVDVEEFDKADAERLYALGFHISSDTGDWAYFT